MGSRSDVSRTARLHYDGHAFGGAARTGKLRRLIHFMQPHAPLLRATARGLRVRRLQLVLNLCPEEEPWAEEAACCGEMR